MTQINTPPFGWHTYQVSGYDSELDTWQLLLDGQMYLFNTEQLADAQIGEIWEVGMVWETVETKHGKEFAKVVTARKAEPCYKCNSIVLVRYGPDPYELEINNDKTPVWECIACRKLSNEALPEIE